jgi:ABC-type transport system substrate-binding protein
MCIRTWISLACLACGVGLLAASALAAPTPQWTLRVEHPVDVDYVDPALAYYWFTWQLEYATCLKLVNHDQKGRLVPEASPWPRVAPDGRRYTFEIRAGFTRFSTGKRVTARDFAASIRRLADERMGGPLTRAFASDVVRVEASGTRLTLELRAPAGDLLARLAMPVFCVLPEGTPIDDKGITAPVPAAGPYFIAEWVARGRLVLRRNPHYHGLRPRQPDRIVVTVGRSQQDAEESVAKGQTDWLATTQPRRWNEPALKTRGVAQASRWYLFFDTRPGKPFASARLRRAVASALDRRKIVSPTALRLGAPTDQLVPRSTGIDRRPVFPLRRTAASLEQARALARGLVPLRITLHGNGRLYRQLEVVRHNLREIGIESDYRIGLRGYFPAPCSADLSVVAIDANYADPASVFEPMAASVAEGCRKRPVWAASVASARRLRGRARLRAFARVERRLAEQEIPATALYAPYQFNFLSARVGCFRPHRVYQVDITTLCLR